MNNVELYENNNSLQKFGANECLKQYSNKIQWKNEASIIDIGSGDGKVTTTVLKKYLPPCNRIIGCDKNEDMVEFANKNYSSDDTRFMLLDIEGDLPEQMRGKFQHAFSFYALHWTENPGVVFSNIYDLLVDGGECLLMILGNLSNYTAARNLARNSRWSSWLMDAEKFVSPYHDCQDPEKEIKQMMYKIGFINVEVQYKSESFLFDSLDDKTRALSAVNPFKIPEELYDEFMEEWLQEIYRIDISNIIGVDHAEASKTLFYNVIYVFAKKEEKLV